MTKQSESYGASEDLVVEITAIQPRLYGFILKRLADHEQALEVLQNTNLVLCRKAGEFQKGSSFAAWAFTIAKFHSTWNLHLRREDCAVLSHNDPCRGTCAMHSRLDFARRDSLLGGSSR